MKKIHLAFLFVTLIFFSAFASCNSGGDCNYPCNCAGSFPPSCEPTIHNSRVCGACGGYITTCAERKTPSPAPKPVPKKGVIDESGFNWQTGKQIKR